MTCLMTGADVYLKSHGGVLHGDMFGVGDVYIFHHCGMDTMKFGPCRESECDYAFDVDCFGGVWIESAKIIALPSYMVKVHD